MEAFEGHCYCGERINSNTGIQHLTLCKQWKLQSPLYRAAGDYLKMGNPAGLLKLECLALAYSCLQPRPEPPLIQPALISPQITGPAMISPSRAPREKIPIIFDEIPLKHSEEEFESLQLAKKLSQEREPEDCISCEVCQKAFPDMSKLMFLECGHITCRRHAINAIKKDYPIHNQAFCPTECGYSLHIEEIRDLIGPEELEKLKDESIQSFIEGTDAKIVYCPCGIPSLLEPGKVDYSYRDEQGNKLSKRAAEHMAKYRFRCGNCKRIICANCEEDPYHLGKTCEEHEEFKQAKHCRYCGEAISPEEKICAESACKKRLMRSCRKTLPCGHKCYGVRREHECIPCLHEECKPDSPNEHDYCSICWTEGLGAAPSVLLVCGHLLHYHCLRKTLKNRWIGPMINFSFLLCPNCKEWIEDFRNEYIHEKVTGYLELYDEIREKSLKRLKFEGMENDERLKEPGDPFYDKPVEYALARFAYYECFECKKPYFGGKKECDQNRDRDNFKPEELVCPSCAAVGMEGTNCPTHGKDFIEFKCKFCCSIAAWFCWGNTHFCDDCHTRQNNGDYLTKKKREELPVCMGPKDCPLEVRHPPNGEEFALGCAVCRNMMANPMNF